ncbi:MAG TPA: hypothetical protein PLX06_08355 [Fimbriimonadaceae bacterium]|nr:hypothetical protein [Fimbriimonadaceae bacterium]
MIASLSKGISPRDLELGGMTDLTIEWGGHVFVGLGPIDGWEGPSGAGLYVVLFQPKPDEAPGQFKALYFGEAEELSGAEFFRAHPKYRCCVSEAEKADRLFFAACVMPETTPMDRKQTQRALAEQYRPMCNW